MNNDIISRDETDRLERILLDWILISFVFFAVGILLKNMTSWGYYFSLIAFIIAIYLLLITVVDYYNERKRFIIKGIEPVVRSDLLAIGVILSILLTIWIISIIFREKILH